MTIALLEKRIGFTLPEKKLYDIPFQSGFLPSEKELQNKNNFYVFWGQSVILASFAIFLYQKKHFVGLRDFGKQTEKAYQYVEDTLYKEYKLQDFVIKTNEFWGTQHRYQEISSKIIILLYIEYGFQRVYNFLLPIIIKFLFPIERYSSIYIENYCKNNNLNPKYENKYRGYQNNRYYWCKISIGKISATATNKDLQKAEKLAEKELIYKYESLFQKSMLPDNKKKETTTVINEERKKQIVDAINLLNLNTQYISFEQMNNILIHTSYIDQYKKKNWNHGPDLATVGNFALVMFSFEYAYFKYSLTNASTIDKTISLYKTNNLSLGLTENLIKYLLRYPDTVTREQKKLMKSYVFRGILASLLTNYIISSNVKILNYAKSYTFSVFTISDRNSLPDLITFTKELANIYGWQFSSLSNTDYQNGDDKASYISSVTIKGHGWEENGIGINENKNTANYLAASDLLRNLLGHCKDDEGIAESIEKILNSIPPYQQEPKKKFVEIIKPETVKTEKKLMPTLTKEQKKHTPSIPVSKPTLDIIVKDTQKNKDKEIFENVPFTGVENVLYICKGKRICEKKGHEIIPATGIITKLQPNGTTTQIRINIHYCKSCKEFFIGYESYKSYQDKHGMLLGNYVFDSFLSPGGGFANLAMESPLSLCGYSVNEKTGPSKFMRREILEYIMDHDILDKSQIINYLEFFIATHKNHSSAVEKWSDDLEWVNKYKINQQIHVTIAKIKQKKKRSNR